MNLSDMQNIIKEFAKEKGICSEAHIRIIDLASEVGELSKEVLKGTNYEKRQFINTEEWKSEIGDVLFSLICLANETNTNLEECLNYVVSKYEKRFTEKGSLSSDL